MSVVAQSCVCSSLVSCAATVACEVQSGPRAEDSPTHHPPATVGSNSLTFHLRRWLSSPCAAHLPLRGCVLRACCAPLPAAAPAAGWLPGPPLPPPLPPWPTCGSTQVGARSRSRSQGILPLH